MSKLKSTFRNIFKRNYVLADSADNSISLSGGLLSCIREDLGPCGKVAARIVLGNDGFYYIFFAGDKREDEEVYSSQLCYNDYYDSVGFETLIPTVNRIFYDYGIDERYRKLGVKAVKIGGRTLYRINKKR